jgi:hypothetical protein
VRPTRVKHLSGGPLLSRLRPYLEMSAYDKLSGLFGPQFVTKKKVFSINTFVNKLFFFVTYIGREKAILFWLLAKVYQVRTYLRRVLYNS